MIPIAKPLLGEEEIAAVTEVLRSGNLTSGDVVAQFEKEFAGYIGVPYAIATSSGTTALFAALWSLDLPRGTEVITTPFTFVASANAILYCQHVPVFCDIDEKTFNISPEALFETLHQRKHKPKALIVVHLYGQPCQMGPIMAIAREYGLTVIEDCAQSHGATWQGKITGSFGHLGVFSFYPTKNMTTGEGGMVVTKERKLAEKIRLFINHGSQIRYRHEFLGHNFRMTNIAAAIGLVQLQRLNERNDKRRQNAKILDELLQDIPQIRTPYVQPEAVHVYHQYTVRCQDRDRLADFLCQNGISTGIYYPLPVHHQPLYKELGLHKNSLPVAENAAREVLSLPVHPAVLIDDLKFIGRKVSEYYAAKSVSGDHHLE